MSRRKKETIANEFIIVPKDMATTPFFTVTPQENRSFITGCRRWDFNMPLTIEHGAVLYNILSFKDPFNPSRDIEFSVCELCKRMFTSDNSENLEKTRKLLLQLETAKVRIVDLDKDRYQIFRLIERIWIEGEVDKNLRENIATSRIKGVVIDKTFVEILEKAAEITGLNLQEFNSIRSRIAKAIYSFLPSRANYHDEQDPFEISLAKLFQQLNITGYESKSKRKQVMTQNKDCVLMQLDGRRVVTGKLRVKLDETKDKSDHKLLTWTEKRDVPPWINTLLSSYEREILERSGIDMFRMERFLKKSKFLLGEGTFDEILAEEKNKVLEGKAAITSSAARLVDSLKRAIESKEIITDPVEIKEQSLPGLSPKDDTFFTKAAQ